MAGEPQTKVFLYIFLSIRISKPKQGISVRFSNSNLIVVISVLMITTLVRIITFYVILVDTPFFFCLRDIDKLRVYLDNTRNKLIKRTINGKERIKVFQKQGYLQFFFNNIINNLTSIYLITLDQEVLSLTETEL